MRKRSRPHAIEFLASLALVALSSLPVSAGTVTYEWTALDTLEKAVMPEGTVEYTYDGDGQRISKTAAGESVVYIRDAAGKVIAEYDEAGDLLVEYVYVGAQRVGRISGAGTRHYYHGDPVGTPLAITDENGNEAWRGENLPFGREVHSSSERDDKRKFTGKELDAETGLHYFNARYYSAELGRFLSVDPVGGKPPDPRTWNRYIYALNQPLGFVDPDGREVIAASRDLATRATFGTGRHQLAILVPDNPADFPADLLSSFGVPPLQDLGDGTLGLIVSATDTDGFLRVEFNEPSDLQSVNEHFAPEKFTSRSRADFTLRTKTVPRSRKLSDTDFINNILTNALQYRANESSMPIEYPGVFEMGRKPNSNAFNPSLLIYSGAAPRGDFWNLEGFDPGNKLRIDRRYFEPQSSP